MKKLFTTVFVMMFGMATVFAQDNKNAPKFEFTDGVEHDFGEVEEGPTAEHLFKFKNVGKEPLIIQAATASCGCTVPTWPKAPILPGKTGEIKVVYNTQGRVGPINKEIFIQSNAVNPDGEERFILRIKGMVKSKAAEAN
ncbi:MAG: DUF1573 domain-containing protein [Chitinophagales bacterium]|nr:DUF1573 domain-containing protein [Chitinophagaceae bacterium]MCB9063682.1 DUF1573 domain-containing protein [Chitinophagales bacterium]